MFRLLKFIKRALEELPPAPEGRRDYYQDTGSDGLLIGVTERGVKSFRVRRKLNGKSVRVTLGRFPDMTIDQARCKAREALSTLAEGINSVAEKRASRARSMTLGAVFENYVESRGQSLKPNTAVVRDYLRFLLLTGLRRGEAARLRWVDVDLAAGTFTISDPKNRERHTLPLSDYLAELLRQRQAEAEGSPYVFPGGTPRKQGKGHIVEPRRWLQQVTRDSEVPFTLHDLRRTFATIAESLDIPHYTLKRLLNHKSGADATAGYVVIDTERLRDPMQRITDYILRVAGAKPTAAVIPIVRTRERTP